MDKQSSKLMVLNENKIDNIIIESINDYLIQEVTLGQLWDKTKPKLQRGWEKVNNLVNDMDDDDGNDSETINIGSQEDDSEPTNITPQEDNRGTHHVDGMGDVTDNTINFDFDPEEYYGHTAEQDNDESEDTVTDDDSFDDTDEDFRNEEEEHPVRPINRGKKHWWNNISNLLNRKSKKPTRQPLMVYDVDELGQPIGEPRPLQDGEAYSELDDGRLVSAAVPDTEDTEVTDTDSNANVVNDTNIEYPNGEDLYDDDNEDDEDYEGVDNEDIEYVEDEDESEVEGDEDEENEGDDTRRGDYLHVINMNERYPISNALYRLIQNGRLRNSDRAFKIMQELERKGW